MKARKTSKFQNELLEFTDFPVANFFLVNAVSFYCDYLDGKFSTTENSPERAEQVKESIIAEIENSRSIIAPSLWYEIAEKAKKELMGK